MEYTIYVGTVMKIKKGFMKGTSRVIYCGMPNKNTFVLCPLLTNANQGFSPNIYYDAQSTIIQLHKSEFEVIEVTPDYIVLGEYNVS